MEIQGISTQIRCLVDETTKVGEARRAAQRLAQQRGFDATAAGRVSIAATELANNLLNHGGGGELLMQPIVAGNTELIELLAIDRGPGMENVDRCMADGYSTGGTAGTGLGAVRRLASEFDVYSVRGEGTVVMARIAPAAAAVRPAVSFGAVSVALHGEHECGDGWRLAARDGIVAVMVADGLGHGAFAAKASRAGLSAFDQAPFETPRATLESAHRAIAGTRGAAAACARIALDGALSYAGIGNISGALVTMEKSQGLVSHNGTLGSQLRKMQQFEYRRTPHTLLVMHSDGLSARWNLGKHAGLMARHPALIAGVLYRDHGRERDDATVVVVG